MPVQKTKKQLISHLKLKSTASNLPDLLLSQTLAPKKDNKTFLEYFSMVINRQCKKPLWLGKNPEINHQEYVSLFLCSFPHINAVQQVLSS